MSNNHYQNLLPLCKHATEIIADFISHPDNCLILASAPQILEGKAFTTLVDRCGDYTMQLDIAEILYHCAGASFEGEPGKFPYLQYCPLYHTVKKEIAMKDDQPGDLAADLRKTLVEYNILKGKNARCGLSFTKKAK